MGLFKYLFGDMVQSEEIEEDKKNPTLMKGNHIILITEDSDGVNPVKGFSCTSKEKTCHENNTKLERESKMRLDSYAVHSQGERLFPPDKLKNVRNKCLNTDEVIDNANKYKNKKHC